MSAANSSHSICTCRKQLCFLAIVFTAVVLMFLQYWFKYPLFANFESSILHSSTIPAVFKETQGNRTTVDFRPIPPEVLNSSEDITKDTWGKLIFRNSSNLTTGYPKIILLWNDNFGMKDWDIGLGQAPFRTCPQKNCYITNNRTDLSRSDAILFHVNELYTIDRPKRRDAHQRWVFFNMESPLFQFWKNRAYKHWDGWFNWTMTYRKDSDIWMRYGDVLHKESPFTGEKLRYKEKAKTVVWMVSNCKSPSKRWKIYEQLAKHVDIDIVGGCGTTKCTRTRQSLENTCMKELAPKYKFYLAFENALCRDYLTEKAFEPLRYGLVPIVYGLGNYSDALPRGSFIDVRDYRSLEDLATYLKAFTNDREGKRQYRKFFKWRSKYTIVGAREAYIQSWCKLCEKLHEPIQESVYSNITEWWNKTGTCVHPSETFQQWNLSV